MLRISGDDFWYIKDYKLKILQIKFLQILFNLPVSFIENGSVIDFSEATSAHVNLITFITLVSFVVWRRSAAESLVILMTDARISRRAEMVDGRSKPERTLQ